jgi:hypothetical protein
VSIIKSLVCLFFFVGVVSASCHESELYRFEFSASGSPLLLDFSGISEVDAGNTRLRVNSGQDVWTFADKKLLVNTSGTSFVNISIVDDLSSSAKANDNTPPSQTKTVGYSDLTKFADGSYFLDFRQEESGESLTWGNYSLLDLEVLCNVSSDVTLNLLEHNQSFLLGINEGPFLNLIFQNENSSEFTRSYMDLSSSMGVFVPLGLDEKIVSIDYVLQDYTGDYRNSVLRLQRQYGVYEDVVIGRWDSGGRIQGVNLLKNTYYKVLVTTDDVTLDKGLVKYSVDGVQNIRVTSPIIVYPDSRFDYGSLVLWQNRTTSRVYCDYSAVESGDFVGASFYVYNVSSGELLYNTEDILTPSGSFSYLVGANETVRVVCLLDVGVEFTKINVFTFRDDARFLDPPFSHDILGFSLVEIFSGVVLFLVVFIFGLGSAGNISFISLAGVGFLWLFSFFNWVDVNVYIMAFLTVFAVLFRLKESKEKGGGV